MPAGPEWSPVRLLAILPALAIVAFLVLWARRGSAREAAGAFGESGDRVAVLVFLGLLVLFGLFALLLLLVPDSDGAPQESARHAHHASGPHPIEVRPAGESGVLAVAMRACASADAAPGLPHRGRTGRG